MTGLLEPGDGSEDVLTEALELETFCLLQGNKRWRKLRGTEGPEPLQLYPEGRRLLWVPTQAS